MCVRQGVLSSHSVACTTFANVSSRNLRKKSTRLLTESVAITVSTDVDLAIEWLGGRVATIVVKMMKRKFATSGIFNFGCAIPGSIEWSLARSLVLRDAGVFVVLVLVEEL